MRGGTQTVVTAVLIGALWGGAAPASAQQTFRDYTVQKGETCTSIAREVYGDAKAYHHIHEHNDLSGQGYGCRAGTTLRLPTLSDRPEATLVARDGSVRARPPKAQWDSVDVGAELYEAWRVNTLERARAQLGFRDKSELQMTANTLVVIYGPSKDQANRTVARRATVEKGRLKTRLADLAGGSLTVDTPQSEVEFGSGKGQVTVEDGESRVANHEGEPARVSASEGAGAVDVDAGYGTRVPTGQPPEPPRELPDTPVWVRGFEPVALALPGARGTVGAAWKPVDAAEAYAVEVTRGRRQVEVIFSKQVPGDITSLQMRGLPSGNYFVSVVAIDGDDFESIPSALRRVTVREVGADLGSLVDADAGRVMIGAALQSPRGMRCRLAEGREKTRRVRVDRPGGHTLQCSGDERGASVELEAVLPTVESSVGADSMEVRRGMFQQIEFRFEPALPPGVTVRADEGLEARGLQVAADRMQVNLSVANEAEAGAHRVGLYYGDIELGRVGVRVPEKGVVRQTGDPSGGPESYLAGLAGYDAVGLSPYWSAEFPVAGATVEAGVGTVPLPYFAAEARMGLALHAGDGFAQVASVRLQAMAGLLEVAPAPYLGVGIGWQAEIGADDRFAPRAAIGVMPPLSETLRLRGEVAAGLTPEGDGVRVLPEARLGVMWRF